MLESQAGGGHALPDTVRETLEPRFDADLSDVRVHADGEAHRMATGLGARAFTYGSDIYFRDGAYDPAGSDGRKTLAHEVAHTVQQGEPRVQRQIDEDAEPEPVPAAPVAAVPGVAEERLATIDRPSADAIDALDVEMHRLVSTANRWLATAGLTASVLHPAVGPFQQAVAEADEARNVMVFDTFAAPAVMSWLRALQSMCARLFELLEAEGSHNPVDAASLRPMLRHAANLRTQTQGTLPLLAPVRAEMRAEDEAARTARAEARRVSTPSAEDRVRAIRAQIDALLRGADVLSGTVIESAQVERARVELEPVRHWLLDPANDRVLGPVWTDARRITYARRIAATLDDASLAAQEVADGGEVRFASPVWLIALADLLAGSVDVGADTEAAIRRADFWATRAMLASGTEAAVSAISEAGHSIREMTVGGVRDAAADRHAFIEALGAAAEHLVQETFGEIHALTRTGDPLADVTSAVLLEQARTVCRVAVSAGVLSVDRASAAALGVASLAAGVGAGVINLVLGTPQFVYDLSDFVLTDIPDLLAAEMIAAYIDVAAVDVAALTEGRPDVREEILRMDHARNRLARLSETLREIVPAYQARFAAAGPEEDLFIVGELIAQIVALIRGVRAVRARLGLPSEEASIREVIGDARRAVAGRGPPPSGSAGEPVLAGAGAGRLLGEEAIDPSRRPASTDAMHMEGGELPSEASAADAAHGLSASDTSEGAGAAPEAPPSEALEWPTAEVTAEFRARFGHLRGTDRWTGALEARYRGLPDAGDQHVWRFAERTASPADARLVIGRREGFGESATAAERAPRRTPVFDDDGQLLRIEETPELRGDPARRADAIAGVDDPAAAATWEVPDDVRARLREVLDAREEARLDRDLAEAFGETEVANEARGRITRASETVGLDIAREWVRAHFPEAVPYPIPGMPTGAGGFDLVYELPGDRFLIVEAKGGSGRLGWRRGVGSSRLVQQGTGPYVDSIIESLRITRDSRALRALRRASRDGRIQYVEVRTPISDGTVERAHGAEFEPPRVDGADSSTP